MFKMQTLRFMKHSAQLKMLVIVQVVLVLIAYKKGICFPIIYIMYSVKQMRHLYVRS